MNVQGGQAVGLYVQGGQAVGLYVQRGQAVGLYVQGGQALDTSSRSSSTYGQLKYASWS